jgi:putative methyltransferase, YaeB/AF_0241 family
MFEDISYKPIGIIHTHYKDITGMPIQPSGADGVSGSIILRPELTSGLKDIEGFSHIILIYHFHLVTGYKLEVTPFMDRKPHGLFATRVPLRPNPIGISTVKLLKTEHNVLYIEDVDIVDGTPLLDIKPFFEKFDNRNCSRNGWLDNNRTLNIREIKSDDRFR